MCLRCPRVCQERTKIKSSSIIAQILDVIRNCREHFTYSFVFSKFQKSVQTRKQSLEKLIHKNANWNIKRYLNHLAKQLDSSKLKKWKLSKIKHWMPTVIIDCLLLSIEIKNLLVQCLKRVERTTREKNAENQPKKKSQEIFKIKINLRKNKKEIEFYLRKKLNWDDETIEYYYYKNKKKWENDEWRNKMKIYKNMWL